MSFSEKERDRDYCRSITEAAGFISLYTEGMSHGEFLADTRTQDAVTMRLQQILESAGKLSSFSKSQLKIDWPSLIAMRNKISHSYADVDPDLIWEVTMQFEEFNHLVNWARKQTG